MTPIVSIIMGSTSDMPVMEKAMAFLNEQKIPFEVNALSAHRTPEAVEDFAKNAAQRGIKVITTTLASSRWKSLDQINEAGRWACEETETPVIWWDQNWRKGGLQERRLQILSGQASLMKRIYQDQLEKVLLLSRPFLEKRLRFSFRRLSLTVRWLREV